MNNKKQREVAVCTKCGARYIPKELESATTCEYCRNEKAAKRFTVCLHNVPLTEACSVCISLNGSTGIRALPARSKTGKQVKVSRHQLKKTQTKGYEYYIERLKAANES